jgi:hypothetical protein
VSGFTILPCTIVSCLHITIIIIITRHLKTTH